jgi:hypothetical protein
VKLLPGAYSSHHLLGAVVESLYDRNSFAAVVWDRTHLYSRTDLPNLQAAECAGLELVEMLCASQGAGNRAAPMGMTQDMPAMCQHVGELPDANVRGQADMGDTAWAAGCGQGAPKPRTVAATQAASLVAEGGLSK